MANDVPAARLLALLIMVVCVTVKGQGGRGSRFPALLVFGDSTLDPGNNNYINTQVKANFPPYGRDFPARVATGRFANGKLASDFLAAALGIKETIPAYLQPGLTSDDLLTGVSFASSGSGYDNFTSDSGDTITFSQQIQYLREYKSRISQIAGAQEGSRIIAESLYYVASGSADWGIGYFYNTGNMGNTRARNFTISQYQDFLIRLGLGYIRDMYEIGARKFLVAGLSILGCSPGERTFLALAGRPCNVRINGASAGFNRKWAPALSNLQASLSGSTMVYSDIYDIMVDAITNPLRYGFLVTTRGCCGTGLAETGRDCARAAALSCPDASRFVWWDSVHPSSAAYQVIANLVMRRDIPRFP